MNPVTIIILFFLVLAAFIAATAFAQRRSVRLISAVAAFAWAFLMFSAARVAEKFNCNAWYSSAASEMLEACIVAMQQGRQASVLTEMQRMKNELEVTYERRGNFRELAERTAATLTKE